MLQIREAAEADAPGIAAVMHDIAELSAIMNRPVEETTAQVARGLALAIPSPSSTVLVATAEEGVIVGYCSVHWVPLLFLPGPEGYITELFVRQSHRSLGVGTQLLEEVRRRARPRDCSRLSLLNARDREAYRRSFYANRDWRERERMANFILPLK